MKLFTKHALVSVVNRAGQQSGLGYGAMGLTVEAVPDDKAIQLLQAAYDSGCRHFDTAERYAMGENYNESVLGDFFQTVPRDSYSVATKYWPQADNTYDGIKAALLASLKRLKLDYVDLYYSHRVLSLDGGLQFAEAATRLKEEGFIKEVGLSEVNGKWLKEIHTKACPIDAVQQEWSLLTRSLESELVPVCKELGIPIVAYRWRLQRVQPGGPTFPALAKENLQANHALYDQVEALSAKYNCTTAQLSLAWLFYKARQLGVTVIPIPGTTKLTNLAANVGSVQIDIDDADALELEGLSDLVASERGNAMFMSSVIESQN